MDFTRVTRIEICIDSFKEIIAGETNNYYADNELPDFIKSAIRNGAKVILTDAPGLIQHRLFLSEKDEFYWKVDCQ